MSESIVALVRTVIGDVRPKTIHDPYIERADIEYVSAILGGDPVGYGAITAFEIQIAERLERRHALAVSSGTAALHLALLALDVKNRMVALPSLNFVAAVAMTCHAGATPLLHANRNMVATEQLGARLDVHLLGHPQEPSRFTNHFDVSVIEDAAEALGSTIDGHPCGSLGDVSILSFNNNKIVTTGGGGMLLTDNVHIWQKARHLATTARVGEEYWHNAIGFNYRMPNHVAALGLGQFRRLDQILKHKRELASRYREACRGTRFTFFDAARGVSNHWINAVSCLSAREAKNALAELKAAGIPARPMFTPAHLLPPYSRFAAPYDEDLATLADTAARMVLLPSGAGL